MPRNKLTVHRKGFTVKRHKRVTPSGKIVTVKKHKVPPTTFKIKDRGKKGRTPKNKRFFKVKRELRDVLGEGYTKLPSRVRYARLRNLDRKRGITSTELWRHLGGLRNVQTNEKAKRTFDRDQEWITKNLLSKRERKRLTRAARRKRLKGGKNPKGKG